MYYRLYDIQTNRCMATGYNAKSEQELTDDYKEYISGDCGDDDDLEEIECMGVDTVMDLIRGNEFIIEKNDIPFDENEIDD